MRQNHLPAPIAKVQLMQHLHLMIVIMVKTIPVVEIAATVAEPNAIRSTAATIQASKIGDISVPFKHFSRYFDTTVELILV